jgi:hypothetical protein
MPIVSNWGRSFNVKYSEFLLLYYKTPGLLSRNGVSVSAFKSMIDSITWQFFLSQ